MAAIHQLVAGFSNGDAISNEARVLQGFFRRWGLASEIYCETRRILPELRPLCRDLERAPAETGPADAALLHLSIGSDANDAFAALRCRRAILYHNISPPEYFSAVQPNTAALLARGREQAARLAGAAEVVLADSAYNARELAAWGYPPARVLPLVLDFDRILAPPDRATRRRYDDGRANVLFVGRCAPNKRIEDALAAFHYFQRYVEPASRFLQVGSFAGMERYHALLMTLQRDLQLRDVVLPGAVRQDQLSAFYRSASVFLCMSEHEGFCIPLLEAMAHDVPVLAFAAAAVPETLDGAGVLFTEKRYDLVAETMGRLVRDASLRAAVLAGQRARLARFRARDREAEVRAALAPLLG
jgi:glycosyltransferase involved in cell wall biosynthesis